MNFFALKIISAVVVPWAAFVSGALDLLPTLPIPAWVAQIGADQVVPIIERGGAMALLAWIMIQIVNRLEKSVNENSAAIRAITEALEKLADKMDK